MSTLTVIIGITVPILTYLIGRYYKAVKQTNYDNLSKARDYWQRAYYNYVFKSPKFQVVTNKDKHPAANDNYLYIEGEIKGNREAGLLRFSQWDEAKATLLKNPEDKPQ